VDRTVRLWDAVTGQERWRFVDHKTPVLSLAVSPDGLVASADSGFYMNGDFVQRQDFYTIRLWDPTRSDYPPPDADKAPSPARRAPVSQPARLFPREKEPLRVPVTTPSV